MINRETHHLNSAQMFRASFGASLVARRSLVVCGRVGVVACGCVVSWTERENKGVGDIPCNAQYWGGEGRLVAQCSVVVRGKVRSLKSPSWS